MSKDVITKHVAHMFLRAIFLSTMIKYQVNILYIFCVCFYTKVSMQVTLYNSQPLEKRTFFFNPLLCTISIWKALCNRPKSRKQNI